MNRCWPAIISWLIQASIHKKNTDASDSKLVAVIIQDTKPIAFYSKKLTETQKKLYRNRKGTAKNFRNFEIIFN